MTEEERLALLQDAMPAAEAAPARMSLSPFMLQIVQILVNRAQPKSVVKMAAVAGVATFFAHGFFGGWTFPLFATGLFSLALFTLVMIGLLWLEERLSRKA